MDGGRINVYSAPVVHDREVVGVLFATYETDRFRQNLEVSVFEGQGYSYVVKQNGDTVVLSSNEGSFAGMENLFTAMKEADPANAASIASLQKAWRGGIPAMWSLSTGNPNTCITPLSTSTIGT